MVIQGQSFCDKNIDQILESNTEARSVGGKAGNTFSVANFAADAEDFTWEEFYGDEAVEAAQAAKATAHMVDGPRKRKRVNYKVEKVDLHRLALSPSVCPLCLPLRLSHRLSPPVSPSLCLLLCLPH